MPYFEASLEIARIRSRTYFGHEGAYWPETASIFGAYAGTALALACISRFLVEVTLLCGAVYCWLVIHTGVCPAWYLMWSPSERDYGCEDVRKAAKYPVGIPDT